jgi:glycosyltransferase involved in cell wall biosynthesis
MAMSFPRIVIASDLEPNAAIINHNRNSLLFKSGQTADLAFQMDKLLRNEIDTAQMESEAIKDIRERYSPEVIATAFVSSIRQIDSVMNKP